MKFKTDITIIIENGDTKTEHTFENEEISITRATKLWIENDSSIESEFIETIKLCHSTDKRTGKMSNYIIKTSEITPVQEFRKYYVSKIDEVNQAITFEWIGY
ncbi:hypothetical protein [Peribacillus simplex]|uniref:Uncharacterized protein n=1 Tax=Peribacillus simplex TaxID=1478 RepID=A0A9W4KS99_9BACI|nr:hypothetical protein [Peribacillus simplex]CAH0169158.1 hypothetical protein SRABI133_01140 [Peribacillus simplex]